MPRQPGFKHTDETRARMRDGQARRMADARKHRQHVAATQSAEARQRRRDKLKAYWADPATHAARRAAYAQPEARAKLLAAVTKARAAREVWRPPAEHRTWWRKMRENGISRREARAAIELVMHGAPAAIGADA